ncbi:MAG: desulfoferrodoxin [bacterium]
MIQQKQVYRCNVCGNIVEVLYAGGGDLVCCGQPMELLIEKNNDNGQEKHVPVVENIDGKIKVKIGSVFHPMENSHYIQWVEIIADGSIYRKFLNPGDEPEVEFSVTAKEVVAREYCNIHGLWRTGK